MEKENEYKHLGWFTEITDNSYSKLIKEYIVEEISYDRSRIVIYLKAFKRIVICPKYSFDCVTGKQINTYFNCYTDGEYDWCDYLAYHVEKYNINLPQEFIDKEDIYFKNDSWYYNYFSIWRRLSLLHEILYRMEDLIKTNKTLKNAYDNLKKERNRQNKKIKKYENKINELETEVKQLKKDLEDLGNKEKSIDINSNNW